MLSEVHDEMRVVRVGSGGRVGVVGGRLGRRSRDERTYHVTYQPPVPDPFFSEMTNTADSALFQQKL